MPILILKFEWVFEFKLGRIFEIEFKVNLIVGNGPGMGSR